MRSIEEHDRYRVFAGVWSWCWLLVVASVLPVVAWWDYSGLCRYDGFYDSGVYLESARMMARGYAAYDAIFNSQPPLWLPLVRFSFFLFCESWFAAQLVMLTAGLITAAAVVAITAELGDRPTAVLALLLLVLAPAELTWSRTVTPEGPSVAFAAVAMALAARYSSVGRRLWLVLASIAITCSILTKLSGLCTVLPILVLVVARWLRAPEFARHRRLSGLGADLLILGIISIGTIVAIVVAAGPAKVWDQAVLFHWRARILPTWPDHGWAIVLGSWQSENLLWLILPLSGLCVFTGWCGLAVLTWMLGTLIGFAEQKPVFEHHALTLAPPVAVATALGWEQLWRWTLLWWYRAETRASRLPATGAVAICLALALFVVAKPWYDTRAKELKEPASSLTESVGADEAVAQEIQRLTKPNDAVLTDAQGIAFLANRDVPPALTDTSFKRIAGRYLSADDVIDESERFHVRAVLLWTGRLSSMHKVVAWVRKRFPRHQSFGDGHDLYLRR